MFMAKCLGDLNNHMCEIYLDDVIIFSKTFSEHLDRLEQVFSAAEIVVSQTFSQYMFLALI